MTGFRHLPHNPVSPLDQVVHQSRSRFLLPGLEVPGHAEEVQVDPVQVVVLGGMADPPEPILPHFRYGEVQAGPHGRLQGGEGASFLASLSQQPLRVRHLQGIDQLPLRHPEGIVGVVHADRPEDLQSVPVDALGHDGRRIVDGLIERPVLLLGLPVAGLPRTLGDAPHDAPGDAVHRGPQDGLEAQSQKGLVPLGRLGVVDQVPVVIQDQPPPSLHGLEPRLLEPFLPPRAARQSGQPGTAHQGAGRAQETPPSQGHRRRLADHSIIGHHWRLSATLSTSIILKPPTRATLPSSPSQDREPWRSASGYWSPGRSQESEHGRQSWCRYDQLAYRF